MAEAECLYQVISLSFLNQNQNPDTVLDGYNREDEIRIAGFNRGIDNTMPISLICNEIKKQCPSIEWQTQMIEQAVYLDKAEKDKIESYMSYGFYSMNLRLRKRWTEYSSDLLINSAIQKMPPLEKDIIIYRSMNDINEELGDIEYLGYLSTSFNVNYVAKLAIEDIITLEKLKSTNKQIILRIRVPAKFKCLYIPSQEVEIILPHLTKLRILQKYIKTYTYRKRDGQFNYISRDILTYDCIVI